MIKKTEFIKSSPSLADCPSPDKPEFAMIGRSNVGKSSLINMLTNKKELAKTSQNPGKTQLINHFFIDEKWYLADLPGYGYAKTSKVKRREFSKLIDEYVKKRENLYCLFILIDVRHKPQKNDLDFLRMTGESGIPLAIVFTKADKLSSTARKKSINAYKKRLYDDWEELPDIFVSSVSTEMGKNEIIDFIESML